MEINDIAWLKYPLAALVLLAFFTVLGSVLMIPARRSLPRWSLCLAPHLGVAWSIVLVSWYARLGVELHWWVAYGAAVMIVIAGIAIVRLRGLPAWRDDAGPADLRADAAALARSCVPWLLGIGFVTAFLLPVISSEHLQAGFVTTFTSGNSDLGSYIGEATNVVKAGFDNAGLYFGWNPGSDPSTLSADVDHTGANAFLALSAVVLNAPVWKVGEIALMVASAGMVAGAAGMVRALMPDHPQGVLVLAGLGSASVMVWYLAANFFLAHLLCLCLILAQLAIVAAARHRLLDPRLIGVLAPLAAATWLSSPEVGVVGILIVALVAGSLLVVEMAVERQMRLLDLLKAGCGLAIAVGAAALLTLPFVTAAVGRTQRLYDEEAVVGWPLDLHNVLLTMLGFPGSLGERSDLGAIVAIVLGAALLVVLVVAVVRRDGISIASGAAVLGLACLIAYGASRWGWVNYQSWKLTMTLSVPVLILIGVILIRALPASGRAPLVAVLACVVALNVAAGARIWDGARANPVVLASHSIPNSLVAALRSTEVQRQPALNIYVPTLHGTMIAPTIYARRSAMSSPSYLSSGQPGPHPYRCSLVERGLYKRRMGKVLGDIHGYLLVATPECK